MDSKITLRLDLDVAATKMISQIQHYNENLERDIKAGLEEAIAEMDVKTLVKEGFKKELEGAIWSVANRYSFREDFKKKLNDKYTDIIEKYADVIAENLKKQLNIDDL